MCRLVSHTHTHTRTPVLPCSINYRMQWLHKLKPHVSGLQEPAGRIWWLFSDFLKKSDRWNTPNETAGSLSYRLWFRLMFPPFCLMSSRHKLNPSEAVTECRDLVVLLWTAPQNNSFSLLCCLDIHVTETCFLQTDKSLLVFFIQSIIRFGTVYNFLFYPFDFRTPVRAVLTNAAPHLSL